MSKKMYFPVRLPEPKNMARMDLEGFEILAKKNYHRWFVPLVDEIVSASKLKAGTIVEVGCGPGLLVREFALRSKKYDVIGIDRSIHALKLGKKNTRGIKNARFIKGLAEKIPLPKDTVNLVVSKDSFHEYKNPALAIQEFIRILKPGSLVCIVDLRRDIPLKILKAAIPPNTLIQKLQYYSTRASYTVAEMRKLLATLNIKTYRSGNMRFTTAHQKRYRKALLQDPQFKKLFQTRFMILIRK